MELLPIAPIARLFPESAPTGHTEDNGDLLDLVVRALPADCLHMTAAAARALSQATIKPEDGQQPQVLYDDALKGGNLPALRWYWDKTAPTESAASTLANHNRLAALQWLYQYHIPAEARRETNTVCGCAAANGNLELLQWARANGCQWGKDTCAGAARNGHFAVLRWMRKQNPPCPWNGQTYHNAAAHKDPEVLVWLHEQGCGWDELTFPEAARRGNIVCMRWLRDRGCHWDELTCSQAAFAGNLEALQWLRAAGCPWDEGTCAKAAGAGHLPILQWARAQNPPCPWDARTCTNAAGSGHMQILQWARAQRPPCPWNHGVVMAAERCGRPEVAAWARANGLVWAQA